MAITRRETKLGPRFDVEWRLPDRSKRRKSFKTERETRVFEAAIVTKSVSGDMVDPRAGRVKRDCLPILAGVAPGSEPQGATWLRGHLAAADRASVRRMVGRQDRPPVDREVGQRDGRIGPEPANAAVESLGIEDVSGPRRRRGSATWPQSRRPHEVSAPAPDGAHLPDDRRSRLADPGVWRPGRRGVAIGLYRDAIWRTDRPER